jgi:hypothetical protein
MSKNFSKTLTEFKAISLLYKSRITVVVYALHIKPVSFTSNLFFIEFIREIKREILVVDRYIQYMGVLATSIELEVGFICNCDGGVLFKWSV